MKKLIQELMVLGMLGILGTSAFAQKGGDKRPPKDPGKFINPDKRQPPPPPRDRPPKDDKKKRP